MVVYLVIGVTMFFLGFTLIAVCYRCVEKINAKISPNENFPTKRKNKIILKENGTIFSVKCNCFMMMIKV